jgi:Flp pilus assembly secretin CpaC
MPPLQSAHCRRVGFVLLLALTAGQRVAGQAPPQAVAVQTVIKSQHLRLPFAKEVQRIAVGDTEILSADLISSREVLMLGRETGRTTFIVWFTDGTLREYLFIVRRDLSVLQDALKRVHSSIDVESAPDRDALVLTGVVPTLVISQTAEAVARNYLDAGDSRRNQAARPFLGVQPGAPAAPPTQNPNAAPGADAQAPGQTTTTNPQARPDTVRLQGDVPPSGTIINLIRLETLPALPEEKIAEAIKNLGGRQVTIRRILKGNLRDDAKDTLVLEGSVANQVALVRIIEIAAQLFSGETITEDNIRVVADEAGALTTRGLDTPTQNTQLGGASSTGALFGGSRGGRLSNQVRRNLGRAKAIEAAGGRILSFIEVSDLPQIRVDIRLLEVNRTKLLSFDPNSALLLSDFRQPSLNPSRTAAAAQGNQAARIGGPAGSAIQNVLSFLSGGLLNEFQFSGRHAAIDSALSLLERQGIARSLSSPSLTVLSGELAQFQVGGEVPIPVAAFGPAFGLSTPNAAVTTTGLFSSVEFIPFGVQLEIRPLVGDDDSITLDVQPQVVTPDATLTDTIRQTTGAAQLTTAFQTRSLRTSSRLQDGQALLIGGLLSHTTSNNTASTPGVRDVLGLGWLFKSFNRNDESLELVVMVNSVIVRTPVADGALWSFPDRDELMRSVGQSPGTAARPLQKPPR